VGLLHQLWQIVGSGMASWYKLKMFIEHASAFTSDSMHVVAGVVIQLLVAMLLRRSVGAWAPWLVVLCLAILNEGADLWIEQWPDLAIQYGESAKDILLSMALPTLLMLVSRFRPQLLAGGARRRSGGRPR
jgi:TRAP-type uncharacterized transport system fused permease subunit